ncbi:MAG: NADH-ubiquinone dehydrogenase [Phyllobacterium sp.]|uniref:NADH-ubiquinone dehydrogenase n=1 Tax=Phyllobacterium sp. TaxID=1871046 RepID=UPI0030F2EB4F
MAEDAKNRSDAWTALMPNQAIAAVNLLTPPLGAAAAASAMGLGIASQMWGFWAGAMAGAFGANLKTAEADGSRVSADVDDLKTIIRGTAATASADVLEAPARPKAVVVDTASVQPATPDASAQANDLKRISGIGPKLEQVLNGMGIRTYAQIAGWTAEDVARVDDELKFGGRILRDDWVGQANLLMGKP